jgi:hypothetical protein
MSDTWIGVNFTEKLFVLLDGFESRLLFGSIQITEEFFFSVLFHLCQDIVHLIVAMSICLVMMMVMMFQVSL